QAFEEGRQYTRIYMDAERPTSWEDVDSLVECMLRLYRKDSFQTLLLLVNEAVSGEGDGIPILEPAVLKAQNPMEQAFTSFVNEQRISSDYFNVNHLVPSFVEPEWTQLPAEYEVTEKYWLGYPF